MLSLLGVWSQSRKSSRPFHLTVRAGSYNILVVFFYIALRVVRVVISCLNYVATIHIKHCIKLDPASRTDSVKSSSA